MIGGLVMLAWLVAISLVGNRPWWATPNLLASTFYGERIFVHGFGAMTFSGIALHLVLAGLIGALFGSLVPAGFARLRLLAAGLAAGLAWYYLFFGLIWRKVNPLIPLYSSQAAMLSGHLVYGACLAGYRAANRAVSSVFDTRKPVSQ